MVKGPAVAAVEGKDPKIGEEAVIALMDAVDD